MGIVKQNYIAATDRNLRFGNSNDKYLCASHIDDYAIKEFILKQGNKGTCTYCNKRRTVASLEDVVDKIRSGVGLLFEDAAESMGYDSSEGGYLGTTFDIEEVINEEIGLLVDDYDLQVDITDSFDDTTWCHRDPYGDRDDDLLKYNWKYFKEIIKHKSRYLFSQTKEFDDVVNRQNPFGILHDVGNIVKTLKLFTSIKKGTIVYRCRQHQNKDDVTKIEAIVAPLEKYCLMPNRMSPVGISMFYGGLNKAVCIAETIDKSDKLKKYYSIGTLKCIDELHLLDLTKDLIVPSIFDTDIKTKNYFSILFIKEFIQDLVKPISRDGREHIEYIPTQVVTEYFRYTFKELTGISIDGILYNSSKNKSEKALVLFYNHKDCLEKLQLLNIKTYMISTP